MLTIKAERLKCPLQIEVPDLIFAYRNGGLSVSPRGGNKDCTTVTAAPDLPVGYVVSARRIADRRMILVGCRLADLLRRVVGR